VRSRLHGGGEVDGDAGEREQPGAGERGAGGETKPGNRVGDRAQPKTERQADHGEDREETSGDERPDEQPLQRSRRCGREPLLVCAEVEGEKGRQQGERARVDHCETASGEGN